MVRRFKDAGCVAGSIYRFHSEMATGVEVVSLPETGYFGLRSPIS